MRPPREWSRRRRFVAAALGSAIATSAVWVTFGPRIGIAVAVLGYIVTAWVSDDALGNCFVFAMLFLLIFAVLLMALVGSVLLNA